MCTFYLLCSHLGSPSEEFFMRFGQRSLGKIFVWCSLGQNSQIKDLIKSKTLARRFILVPVNGI